MCMDHREERLEEARSEQGFLVPLKEQQILYCIFNIIPLQKSIHSGDGGEPRTPRSDHPKPPSWLPPPPPE